MRPLPVTVILSVALAVLPACGSDATEGAEPTSRRSFDSTIHFVEVQRLQGAAEGIPCLVDDYAPLAEAARFRDELREAGEHAFLVVTGDSLMPTHFEQGNQALNRSFRTRGNVVLEALAAADVDLYVPGQFDLILGPGLVLDRCAELGIPVLASNLYFQGQEDVLRSKIIERDGLRVGCFGVTRGNNLQSTEIAAVGAAPALRQLTAELASRDATDFNIVFSNVTQTNNLEICKIPGVHAVVGAGNRKEKSIGVEFRDGTAYMLVQPVGSEIGHTTLRVVDGDMNLTNTSGTYYMPLFLAAAEKELRSYMEMFGTTDLTELTRLARPSQSDYFFEQARLIKQNREALAALEKHTGSAIDHRPATRPVKREHPAIESKLASLGDRLTAAFEQGGLPPLQQMDPMNTSSPAETCKDCHFDQYEFWKGTAHAGSYDRLVQDGHGLDGACLDCHTAAFDVAGGYLDPRLEAPFGGVSCWECHYTLWAHHSSQGRVVDPDYVNGEADMMFCEMCHTDDRSPGWDRWDVLESVTCPPMVDTEPPLIEARRRALATVRGRLERQEGRPGDRYLEGRALVGLGLVEDGKAILLELAETNQDNVDMAVDSANLLDRAGESATALEIMRSILKHQRGDPKANEEYVRLLLEATRIDARNPDEALRQLRFLIDENSDEPERGAVTLRAYKVDALFALGLEDEGTLELRQLATDQPRDHRVERRWRRYLDPSGN